MSSIHDESIHTSIGLSTEEALKILSNNIDEELFKCKCHSQSIDSRLFWLKCSYHHSSVQSLYRWPSIVLLLLESIIYLMGYLYGHFTNATPLLLQSTALLIILIFNMLLIGWDTRMRHNEMHHKARLLSNQIKCHLNSNELMECWKTLKHYPHLHTPQSPCISLQWAFRDGKRVNLPTPLLVKGDVILLCPGHAAPGKCRSDEDIRDCIMTDLEHIELCSGELFTPTVDCASSSFTTARLRRAVRPVKFVMLETIFINELKTLLSYHTNQRPATAFEKELNTILAKYIERFIIPLIGFGVLIASGIHYGYLESNVEDNDLTWKASLTLLLLRPAMAILPLLPLTLPLSWILLNIYGIAHLMQCLASFRNDSHTSVHGSHGSHGSPGSAISNMNKVNKVKNNVMSNKKEFYLEELDSDRPNVPLIQSSMSWQSLYFKMKELLLIKDDTLWRSSNLLQVLGSITALCCIDKKGILSWPNPTADKLFFLTSPKNKRVNESFNIEDEIDDIDDDTGGGKKDNEKIVHIEDNLKKSGLNAECIQLDITHDPHNAFGLQFDDTEWKQYLSNLKPLGLGILLNTCNRETQEEYTKFCDHIACESLHNEAAVPVVNKRCLCELARQIGFTQSAIDGYEFDRQLALFRHVRPEVIQKGKLAKSLNFPRLKMPFPNMACSVIKDIYTCTYQLFSQGTGDLVLDACTEYWNGHDLNFLTDSDRKKILDFYQRTSLASYCMAFAYSPLSSIHKLSCFSDCYIELPPDSSHLFPSQKSLDSSFRSSGEHHHQLFSDLTTKSISNENLMDSDATIKSKSPNVHIGRPKSIFSGSSPETYHIEPLMHQISNEVFIGMVAMQHQACSDFVQLVEQLDNACIRFVHFSKENELRSRVFSEKMGLESGWNCHISLLSDEIVENNYGTISTLHHVTRGSKSSIHESQTMNNSIGRSQSAPGSVNLEISTVKFVDNHEMVNVEVISNDDSSIGNDDINENLTNSHSDIPENGQKSKRTASNISPAPSRLTESTDRTAPIQFDMSNRSKLPKGIENIRPHLESVDNVPLLVSLFTDCVPQATHDMVKIMQEYGEVVCIVGSSANYHNIPIFLQADTSIGIEPMYPQVCITEPIREADLSTDFVPENFVGPMDLAKQLITLPCSLSIRREESYSLYNLIMEARHYTMNMRNCFQFYLCSCLSLSIAQLLSSLLFLPPLLSSGLIIWLVCVVLPCLSASLMGTPLDEQVMNLATGKNLNLNKETITYFFICYLIKFIPSVIVTVLCYGLVIGHSCQKTNIGSSTAGPCWMFSDIIDNIGADNEHDDNLWASELLIGQTFAATLFVLYLIIISCGFVYRSHLLWQRNPLTNHWWIIFVVVLLLLHIIVCFIEVIIYVPSSIIKTDILGHTPIYVWCIGYLWPFLLISINTIIKRYEIKAYQRQQRRARLEFGTKLGMNSPF